MRALLQLYVLKIFFSWTKLGNMERTASYILSHKKSQIKISIECRMNGRKKKKKKVTYTYKIKAENVCYTLMRKARLFPSHSDIRSIFLKIMHRWQIQMSVRDWSPLLQPKLYYSFSNDSFINMRWSRSSLTKLSRSEKQHHSAKLSHYR